MIVYIYTINSKKTNKKKQKQDEILYILAFLLQLNIAGYLNPDNILDCKIFFFELMIY